MKINTSPRKKIFKPIYTEKYQVREKTNVEPLLPMGDQEIISPYSINTIHSKVYMRSSFLLLFSNWHVSDCNRYTEVRYGGEKRKKWEKKNKVVSALHLTLRVLRLIFFFFFSTGITDFVDYSLRNTPYMILCADQFKMSRVHCSANLRIILFTGITYASVAKM